MENANSVKRVAKEIIKLVNSNPSVLKEEGIYTDLSFLAGLTEAQAKHQVMEHIDWIKFGHAKLQKAYDTIQSAINDNTQSEENSTDQNPEIFHKIKGRIEKIHELMTKTL